MIRSLHLVYACRQPTDMRRSFDGLSGMVHQPLQQAPLSVASLEALLLHPWLQTHPEHRWTIAERRKLERQCCSDD